MLDLVIGGSASGKSVFAESLILRDPALRRYYLATMEVFDRESRARVERHRAMRAGKGFETLERPVDLADLALPAAGAVLLEDLGNLAANELFSLRGAGNFDAALDAILTGIDAILAQCGYLVVVSNDIFSGGNSYAGDTDTYLRLLGAVHQTLARRSGHVYEVICGIPHCLKGETI